jgi:transposase-like protein
MKKRFSDELMVAILREKESGQKTIEQINRKHRISQNTFCTWQRRCRP